MQEGKRIDFVVQPYQFEPLMGQTYDDTTGSDDSESENFPILLEHPPADLDEWCTCNNCEQMPSEIECCCCKQFQRCCDMMDAMDLSCITNHHGFLVNCLDREVLRLAFYDYLDYHGHIGDDEPIHEVYRYIAYRRFSRWLFGRIGKKNRKVLPSCVVLKIREAFPSASYAGFKYPKDD